MRQNEKENITTVVVETRDIETGCIETGTISNPSSFTIETAQDGNAAETDCEHRNQ